MQPSESKLNGPTIQPSQPHFYYKAILALLSSAFLAICDIGYYEQKLQVFIVQTAKLDKTP
jgi:hypothetical protein